MTCDPVNTLGGRPLPPTRGGGGSLIVAFKRCAEIRTLEQIEVVDRAHSSRVATLSTLLVLASGCLNSTDAIPGSPVAFTRVEFYDDVNLPRGVYANESATAEGRLDFVVVGGRFEGPNTQRVVSVHKVTFDASAKTIYVLFKLSKTDVEQSWTWNPRASLNVTDELPPGVIQITVKGTEVLGGKHENPGKVVDSWTSSTSASLGPK